jgi:GNAT superfamily N-acetyltransferase
MLVAWRDRIPIGYMWYTDRVEPDIEVFDLPLPPGAVYGFGMYVVPQERRQGIGGALIAERGRHAKARGFTHAWRMVRDDNVAARRIAVRASSDDRWTIRSASCTGRSCFRGSARVTCRWRPRRHRRPRHGERDTAHPACSAE